MDGSYEITIDALREVSNRPESHPCIMRVVDAVKKGHEKCFLPEVVGLGAYHHSYSPSSLDIRSMKLEAVRIALTRMKSQHDQQAALDELRRNVRSLESSIMNCYDDCSDIRFECDKFIMDACFFLEIGIILAVEDGNLKDKIEWIGENKSPLPIFDRERPRHALIRWFVRDFFKLENQIPLVLLRKMMELQGFQDEELKEIIETLLLRIFPFGNIDIRLTTAVMYEDNPPRHVLEWLHMEMKKTIKIREKLGSMDAQFSKFSISIPNVETLKRAGITVEQGDEISIKTKYPRSLKAVLTIPRFHIKHVTELIFRNVIIFENNCERSQQGLICSYVMFMDYLINTKEDAALLQDVNVIDGLISINQNVELFKGLGDYGSLLYYDDLIAVAMKIRHLLDDKKRIMMVEFYQKYCSRPWLLVAAVAAFIVLVCTIAQTIFTAKQL